MRTFEFIARILSIVMLVGLGVFFLCGISEVKDYPEYSTLFVSLYITLGSIFLVFGLYGAYMEIKNVLKK